MVTFRVEVRYLPGVEDPEALTVKRNLKILGYDSVSGVSMARIYELTFEDGKDAHEKVEKLARNLLSNPVINSYTITETGD
ncbi:MAG: phosphoribosylformylglycinamidine synthase subunit PurS [Thermoplasmataceae archaeon]|jgi:phosphoribosylformylglycinamidine synthase|nr:phosphoribosylformylglycinamidine synthase subunit PurS [Candidatus Thermoplasmatota archaeon]